MSEFSIKCLHDNAECFQDFLALPERVYNNDFNYTKEDFEKTSAEISRFKKELCLPLVIFKDNSVVARLCAIIPEEPLKGFENKKVGMIGYFESFNDQQAVNLLFDKALKWFKARKIDKIIGPIDGDTWHRYRFVTDQGDKPQFLSEPYNKPYYPELWRTYGFEKLAGYFSKLVSNVDPVLPIMERFYKRAVRNGFSFRCFNADDFERELKHIYQISCDSFSNNFLYKHISEEDFIALYAKAKKIVKPELIWFCLNQDNIPCGFVFAIPDYGEMLRLLQQKSVFAKLKAWWIFHFYDTVNIKSIGSLKCCRNKSIGPALVFKAYESIRKLKRNKANMCLIHDDNVSGKLDGGQGEIIRKYTIYTTDI